MRYGSYHPYTRASILKKIINKYEGLNRKAVVVRAGGRRTGRLELTICSHIPLIIPLLTLAAFTASKKHSTTELVHCSSDGQ